MFYNELLREERPMIEDLEVFEVADIPPHAFRAVLEYIYVDKTNITVENAMTTLYAGNV